MPDTHVNAINNMQVVVKALSDFRSPLITQELDLQGMLAAHLTRAGVVFQREVKIGSRCRIDFLTIDGVGIEVKKGHPNGTKLEAQLYRYCASDFVQSLVLVTPWAKHLRLSASLAGKPIAVVSLNKLWGVAL